MRGKRMRRRFLQGDKPGSGPGGNCVCPACGFTTPHSRLKPCNQTKCPKCGAIMTRA